MTQTMIRKGQPDGRTLHTNRPLTNMSQALFQSLDGFVHDRLFPTLPVDKRSDKYTVYPRGHFNRNPMKKRAPGTESAGVGYEVSEDSFFCDVFALHVDIADQDEANADEQFDLDREAMILLTTAAKINREVDWSSRYWGTGKWGQDVSGVASSPTSTQFIFWDDYVNSNPLRDIEKWMANRINLGLPRPNVLVVDRLTWGALKNHPVILDRINRGQTSGPAMVMKESVAALMELDRIVVGEGVQNTAAEGAADAHSPILGDNALLAYVSPNVGRYAATAGLTFAWRGFLGSNAAGIRIKRFRMDHLESRRVEIESAYASKLVAADLGVFFSNTLA
jgi:hypothetical protein